MDQEPPPIFSLPPEMLDWMNPDYQDAAGGADAEDDFQTGPSDNPFPQP